MNYSPDADGYVHFGDVSRGELNRQCQYGSQYVDGSEGYPNLGEGLRFRNLDMDYHDIEIHVNDIPELVRRYKACQASRGQ